VSFIPKGEWTPPDAGDAPAEMKVSIHDGPVMRFREAAKSGVIDIHIIRPGRGSSGYYKETVLQKACEAGVYPVGMHMHWDHPTLKQEQDQPARTLTTLTGVLTEAGHYDMNGWDGSGVYAKAKVFPEFLEKVRALDGHIGISHYVSGIAEQGEAPDGKHGMIITELQADPLNTVDFVTVPGAGGSYRTMFTEAKGIRHIETDDSMSEKPEKLTLAEIQTNHPEVYDEMKQTLAEELKIEFATKDQTAKLAEAADRIKALEQENGETASLAAECKAAGYVKEELAKAKFPAGIAESLAKTLVKQVVIGEDRKIDAAKFAVIVAEGIKAEQEKIASILKEYGTGIRDNGAGAPTGEG